MEIEDIDKFFGNVALYSINLDKPSYPFPLR